MSRPDWWNRWKAWEARSSGPCSACGKDSWHRIDCPVFMRTVRSLLIGGSVLVLTLLVASILGDRMFLDAWFAGLTMAVLLGLYVIGLLTRHRRR